MRAAARDPESARGGLMVIAGTLVLVVWCAALAAGLGRQILGRAAPSSAELLLFVPGVALGAGLVLGGAVRRLRAHAPRWVPRMRAAVAPDAPHRDEDARARHDAHEHGDEAGEPAPLPLAPDKRRAPPELAIVHLGPGADPAWAAWGIAWEAPGLGAGFVPLPAGARIALGRDPSAPIVARLDQVSWRHLELDVQEARVIAFDVGSTNGTRTSPDGAPVAPNTPLAWAPGEALYLAHPVALKLVLEPLR